MTVPVGWVETNLDSIVESDSPICYGVLKPGTPNPGGTQMVRVTDIRTNFFDKTELVTISDDLDAEFRRSRITAGDILISVQGTVGRVAVVPESFVGGNISRTIARIRVNDAIEPAWLWRALMSPQFQTAALSKTGGTTRDSLNIGVLRELLVHIPPLAEQRRITAELDALNLRIGHARAELERTISLQRRFRRRVFDAAVAGELTSTVPMRSTWTREQWRLIEERRADYLGNRRGSRLRSGLGAKVEPLQGSRSNWLDCKLADVIALRVGHAFRSADFVESGVRLLRGANVAPGRVDWNDTVCLPEHEFSTYSQHALCEGDIVLAMDRPLISSGLKIAQVKRGDEPCLLVQRVANPRPTEFLLNEYLKIVLQSSLFIMQIEDHATGSDLPHISSNDILTTSCPLPPLDEQQRIVEIAQKSLAHAACLEAEAARAAALLDRLEASILAKAFRGGLVPQDPADEPAAAMLDRIRAERATTPKPKRGRRAAAAGP